MFDDISYETIPLSLNECTCVQYDEAEALSHTVVSMGEEAGEFLPRAYLALGLSCSLQASEGTFRWSVLQQGGHDALLKSVA